MATTTNYGWTTPDNTALVKDGALAIRTLGSSVDTTTKALNPSTTLGDIEYRSATANTNTRLPVGTTGQVLTVSGGVPTWATPAGGGGKVLQVITASAGAEVVSTSTTYADTGVSATITPTSATSKILVIANQNGNLKNADTGLRIRLVRGSTELTIIDSATTHTGTSATNHSGGSAITYLDEPATTSATTYKTQFRTNVGGAQVLTNFNGYSSSSFSSITLLEIGA
jgi:hypothetical protein